ncbi:SDR family NAD(P)-dependent oxidoreductase [Amorphus orientalis]|uniref:NAD(P)-dependent dehydrogenase (Short-subunit alcohol dehydrogenase family) n=1 Tax=Amorphus orientalis TaxID=649198 RepID=A0AAE3VSF3_9HYPH|nr:SDR family NAD(P)-dependent oxidoreductase [Amorphus orientalis]MDQ0317281.1 NAD(P)-dependent dehydrogenase (short-subunit alcohol dehydrogenase family) [Amorphus orientalis]
MKPTDLGAIVTGGGSGLGEATARMLAARGAKVGVLDLDRAKADAVAADIGGVALGCDVTDAQGAEAAIAEAASALGGIRILVNCAGVGVAARILGRDGPMPLADFETVIRINLIGTFNMMRLAAAQMADLDPLEDGSRGAIVNTASVAATDGQIGQSAYAASKGGIVSLALPAAREFARIGVRVNTVAPGIFFTPLLYNIPEEARGRLAESIPFPSRLGDPSEFADAVLFIIENAYLNGEVIRLDGAVRLPPK